MGWHAETGFRVTVVGGSIGGLCAGIVLRGLGADVRVYERSAGPMETRGAGIVVQAELLELLRRHDAPELPVTSCSGRRYLQPDGGDGTLQPMPQRFTSWEAIYRTLRAAFPDDRYVMSAAVGEVAADGDRVRADIAGLGTIESDLLVAADGAGSALRGRLLPDVRADYAGYVAWRGTLDEAAAPRHLVSFFDDAFTFSEARSGGHMLVYLIPGDGADTAPGRRRLNWVWYVGTDEAELQRILVDRDGQAHHGSLPQGLVPAEQVAGLHARAAREVHPLLAELVAATPDPFLQTIVDVVVPRTVFGRILLVGDAAFVVRPHTAGAAAKAANDALIVGRSLDSARQNVDAGLQAAQRVQLDYSNGLAQYGIALGRRWAG